MYKSLFVSLQPNHEVIQNKIEKKRGKKKALENVSNSCATSLRLSEKRQENLPSHLRVCSTELQFGATLRLRVALIDRRPGESDRVENDEPKGIRFRTCAMVFASPAELEEHSPVPLSLVSVRLFHCSFCPRSSPTLKTHIL